jgi:hypothetical protein
MSCQTTPSQQLCEVTIIQACDWSILWMQLQVLGAVTRAIRSVLDVHSSTPPWTVQLLLSPSRHSPQSVMQAENNDVEASTGPSSLTVSARSAKRCPACKSDLSIPGLDLPAVAGSRKYSLSVARSLVGVKHNCMLCCIIAAVSEDAREKHNCEIGLYALCHNSGSGTEYSLTFMNATIPELHNVEQVEPGSVAVYLKGQLYSAVRALMPLLTFVTESPIPIPLQTFKPIPQQADTDAGLNLARKWLSSCRDEHSQCRNRYDKFSPARLLDIRGTGIKLVLRSENTMSAPYVALSHCWGGAQPLQTTDDNIVSFQQDIPLGDLPRTFKDAIRISRTLGFGYLWIDSLCIIQDSNLDWEEQSSMMASIYSNADLVLAGSAARSATEGFLGARQEYRETTVTLHGEEGPTSLVYRLVHCHRKTKEPLDYRGWTLQERFCARRFLSYGEREMFWECRESCLCECGGTGFNVPVLGNFQAEMENTTRQEFANCWRVYVARPYSTRLLTKDTDIPVAISALAARFQSRFQGTYIGGLWKEDLLRELLWTPRAQARATSFFAPSWSWMSIQTDKGIMFYSDVYEHPYLADVLEAKSTPSSINPFGPVISGSITLASTLVPAMYTCQLLSTTEFRPLTVAGTVLDQTSAYMDTPFVSVCVQLGDGTEATTTRRAFREEKSNQTSFSVELLPLIRHGYTIRGLLVGRSTTCSGAFERLGTFHDPSETFDAVMRDHGVKQTITLV